MAFLEPHSPDWFQALGKLNPEQAAMTRQILSRAPNLEVCSVCGDAPAQDYEVVGMVFAQDIPATIRLCKDCEAIRKSTQGEKHRLIPR